MQALNMKACVTLQEDEGTSKIRQFASEANSECEAHAFLKPALSVLNSALCIAQNL